jgi:uncharacterized protein (DUF433 family)
VGYEGGPPLLHVLDGGDRRQAATTFIALAEAWVLWALREAGVRPRRIRPALQRLEREFGREYVLTAHELATDGIDVLWDFSRSREGEGLIDAGTGQHVIREIVADYLQYLSWGSDVHPHQLRLRHCEPSKVVVDPERSFGQPIFEGARVRMADVAGMLKAGEHAAVVAEELGVGIEDVRTAARVVLGRAA